MWTNFSHNTVGSLYELNSGKVAVHVDCDFDTVVRWQTYIDHWFSFARKSEISILARKSAVASTLPIGVRWFAIAHPYYSVHI